jgi:hypothetical protein
LDDGPEGQLTSAAAPQQLPEAASDCIAIDAASKWRTQQADAGPRQQQQRPQRRPLSSAYFDDAGGRDPDPIPGSNGGKAGNVAAGGRVRRAEASPSRPVGGVALVSVRAATSGREAAMERLQREASAVKGVLGNDGAGEEGLPLSPSQELPGFEGAGGAPSAAGHAPGQAPASPAPTAGPRSGNVKSRKRALPPGSSRRSSRRLTEVGRTSKVLATESRRRAMATANRPAAATQMHRASGDGGGSGLVALAAEAPETVSLEEILGVAVGGPSCPLIIIQKLWQAPGWSWPRSAATSTRDGLLNRNVRVFNL